MMALRWPVASPPMKSQFFLLCADLHKKNYANMRIMRTCGLCEHALRDEMQCCSEVDPNE
jgi:hypothetical protein